MSFEYGKKYLIIQANRSLDPAIYRCQKNLGLQKTNSGRKIWLDLQHFFNIAHS